MRNSLAQDDARENQLIDLFNLERPENRVRHGTDAILKLAGKTLEFELKSATTESRAVSTVRDLGPSHIEKWHNKHWIFAFYSKSGLAECKYVPPDGMKLWIDRIWNYIEADFRIAERVPPLADLDALESVLGKKAAYSEEDARRLHKNQLTSAEYKSRMDTEEGYTPARMLDIFRERTRYLIERGSTLNNPHIPASFFEPFPAITKDHAVTLRKLARNWLKSRQSS